MVTPVPPPSVQPMVRVNSKQGVDFQEHNGSKSTMVAIVILGQVNLGLESLSDATAPRTEDMPRISPRFKF